MNRKFWKGKRLGLTAAAALVCTAAALAQKSDYADYPQQRVKVQSLEWQAVPSWATLSLELRDRVEGQTSFAYGQGNGRVYNLTRVFGGLEIRPSRAVTGYLQFLDTHALGLPTHLIPAYQRDVFDLRQGFLDVHFSSGNIPLHLSAGRRELKFGSERVLGISDWTNNSRTYDGFFATVGKSSTLTLFSTSVVATHPTSLDRHGAGLTFHGGYGTVTAVPKARIYPFVIVRALPRVTTPEKHVGSEAETTFGIEAEGSLPGNFTYQINGDLQRGSYANDSIHAGESFGKLAYMLREKPWSPRIGVEYDYATGNAHRGTGRISTYDQLYPSNHNAFGLVDLFGFQNIRQERLNLDLRPAKKLTFLFQGEFLNLVQKRDNLYSLTAATAIAAPAAGFRGDQIGEEVDGSAKYLLSSSAILNVGLGHLFPGTVLTETNHGAPETLGYFSLTYRFRVNSAAGSKEKSIFE